MINTYLLSDAVVEAIYRPTCNREGRQPWKEAIRRSEHFAEEEIMEQILTFFSDYFWCETMTLCRL